MAATTRPITAALRAEGYPLELVKGEGYFYFVYDAPDKYETESVYVYRLNELTREQWIEQGRDFGERMQQK